MKRILLIFLFTVLLTSQAISTTRTVTSCADSGPGSLRQAISVLNNGDVIEFNITSEGIFYSTGESYSGFVTKESLSNKWYRIVLNSTLTISNFNIQVKGSTQPTGEGFNTYGPEIEISAAGNFNALSIGQGGTIEGVVINKISGGTGSSGIWCTGQGVHIYGCYIGTSASGEYKGTSKFQNGIYMSGGADDCVIGGAVPGMGNLISGNVNGVRTDTENNYFLRNYIGTSRTGSFPLPNKYGIYINSSSYNNVGDGTAFGRNLISGNVSSDSDSRGIYIYGSLAHDNEINGNYIGTNFNGTAILSNDAGIEIDGGAYSNKIGHATTECSNVISGNKNYGVLIVKGCSNEVLGNYIGIDKNGTAAKQNGIYGVYILGDINTCYNKIGNGSSEGRNVISGHSGVNDAGICISGSPATNNYVLCNYIGLNAAGTGTIPNYYGVVLTSGTDLNEIGNNAGTGRNVISGNSEAGVCFKVINTSYNKVLGNYIGLGPTGEAAMGNSTGIIIMSNASSNYIGDGTEGGRNVIAGNAGSGIDITGSGTNSNEVLGNWIGTTISGEGICSNYCGVSIGASSKYNKIGDGTPGGRNIISANTYAGISIGDTGTNSNEVLGNFIGTTKNGNAALDVSSYGVLITNEAQHNKIGNDASGGNVISGNHGSGVFLSLSNTDRNEILGNKIGVDASGTIKVANGTYGILLSKASSNKIGNGTAGGRNVISGNGDCGLNLSSSSSNEILGNYIGVGSNGNQNLGNMLIGIYISGTSYDNRIGDGTQYGCNIIGCNQEEGINISSAGNLRIYGNYIGVGADGNTDCFNIYSGIRIGSNPFNANIKIGSTDAGCANYISGNHEMGIDISSPSTNEVAGNYIGIKPNGASFGNRGYGIAVSGGAKNLILGPYNHIANNGSGFVYKDGICISGSSTYGIKVTKNEIYSNYRYGISLDAGANHRMPDPVIKTTAYHPVDKKLTLTGTAQANAVVEVFKAAGNQGKDYKISVTADGSGNWTATIEGETFTTSDWLTVTQTSTLNSTSQFAATKEVTIPPYYQPDNMVALSTSEVYRWEGTYEATPLTQVQTKEVIAWQKAVAYFKIVNAGNMVDSFRVTGDASSGSFEVKYYDANTGGNDITNLVTSGAVVFTAVAPAATVEMRVEVSFSGTAPASKEINLTAGSTNEAGKKDAVKAVMLFEPPFYKPDAWVSVSGSWDYRYEYVYEDIPLTQVVSTESAAGNTAVIDFNINNRGNVTDWYTRSGTGSGGDFTVRYYDSMSGGTEITDDIVNRHAPVSFYAGGSGQIWAEVLYTGMTLATKEIVLTFTSTTDSSKKDSVKAIITCAPVFYDRFRVSAPSTVVSGAAFSVIVTAEDGAGNVYTGAMIGTTYISVDSGTVSQTFISPSAFSYGVWTGDVSLSSPGYRTITVSNGTKAGTVIIAVTNASKEYPAGSFPGAPGVSVSVPAGAATADVTVVADESVSPGAPPAGFSAGGKVYSFTGPVSTFLIPLTITMPLVSVLKAPEVRYWDGTKWCSDGITILSYSSTSITFTTTHFTMFIPLGTIPSNLVRFGPNPYNPNSGASAQIWYWLDANADTSIYIIDLSGTVVWKQSCLSGATGGSLGANSIVYNGTTAGGDILGNGVYLYKIMQSGRAIGGGKIAIIK